MRNGVERLADTHPVASASLGFVDLVVIVLMLVSALLGALSR